MKKDEVLIDLIPYAKQCAEEWHGDQKYGDEPYSVHLAKVAQVLTDFGYTDTNWQVAAWLHDAMEDTNTKWWHISVRFGINAANLVWAVTGEGSNRKERNASIAEKINILPKAAILKCADRIANVENCVATGHSMGKKYVAEMEAFSDIIQYRVPVEMWNRLEKAISQVSST